MQRYFIITAIFFTTCLPAISQTTDSLRIENLRTQLPRLQGNARVDSLNVLAEKFSTLNIRGGWSWKMKADSVSHYASKAYSEANKNRYKKGIAYSLTNLGSSEWLKGIDLRIQKKDDAATLVAAEKYFVQALPLAKEIHNDEILAQIYYDLSDILFLKSKRQDYNIRGEYLKKAIFHFRKAGNEAKEAEACTWLCEDYSARGYYEKGFEYCQRSLELAIKAVDRTKTKEEKEYRHYLVQQSFVDMAEIYKAAGDYTSALDYLRQSRRFGIANKTKWELDREISEIFWLRGQNDSALYYAKAYAAKNPENDFAKLTMGLVYLKTQEYDKALPHLETALVNLRKKSTNGRIIMSPLLAIGKVYAGKKDYKTALNFAREGTDIAQELNSRPVLLEGYELLSLVHHNLGKNDSAYAYLVKHTSLKDSLQNRQLLFRLNNYKQTIENNKRETKIELLNKDNKIKDQKLKEEARLKQFLVAGLLALVLMGVFLYRNLTLKGKNEQLRRERLEDELRVQQLASEKKQAVLQQQATDLEMQALRAQMNPHFIFNCLSSINRFILKNETEAASDYLTRFSRLIRMVLVHSQQPLITLEEELDMLRLYLDMERLRFKNAFDYNITYTNDIDAIAVYIPPLLLQPFCENAIWHGLMQKDEKGRLDIQLNLQQDMLSCVITDNGIGRQRAVQFRSKSVAKDKSLGLKITAERLALLSEEKGNHSFYEIEDLTDEKGEAIGTRVRLLIKCQEPVEVPVWEMNT